MSDTPTRKPTTRSNSKPPPLLPKGSARDILENLRASLPSCLASGSSSSQAHILSSSPFESAIHYQKEQPQPPQQDSRSPSESGSSDSSMSRPVAPNATDVYRAANNSENLDFSSIEGAKRTIAAFLFQLTAMTHVPQSMVNDLCDLLVNLKQRNLRWTRVQYQIVTAPATITTADMIALQSLLATIPEFR